MLDESQGRWRALALGAFLIRVQLEANIKRQPQEPRWPARIATLNEWARLAEVDSRYSQRERALCERSAGSWSANAIFESSWQNEGLTVLVWALGGIDQAPGYDRLAPAADAHAVVPVFGSTAAFLERAKWRAKEEIQLERRRAQLWHWRAYAKRRGLDAPASLVGIVDAAMKNGVLEEAIDGDLYAFGRAYRDLEVHQCADAFSIAIERDRAFRWICGLLPGDNWDTQPDFPAPE